MRYIIANKEKIVIGVIILFMIIPVLGSLSYAEFVEHLWPLESSQHLWYDSTFLTQFDSNDHLNPFDNSIHDPCFT